MKEDTQMTYRKLFIMFAITAVAVLALGFARAQVVCAATAGAAAGQKPSGCGAPMMANHPQTVRLTSAQQAKMVAINKRYNAKTQALQKKANTAQREVAALVSSSSASEQSISRKMHEFANAYADLQVAQAMQQREIQKIYTPAQKAAMAASGGGCGCGGASASCGSGCGGSCGGASASKPAVTAKAKPAARRS